MGITYLVVILVGSQFIMKAPAGYKPEGWKPTAITAVSSNTGKEKTWSQMLADPLFYLLFSMLTIGATSGLMIISQASPIAQEVVGLSAEQAAFAVSLVAIANMAGRITWGAVSDKIGRYNALPIMYVVLAAAMFSLTLVTAGNFTMFLLAVMFVGFCFGGFMGVFPALTADCFGAKNNGVNYGFMFGGFALGGYIGPVMAATIKAGNNGDYTNAFLIAAAMCILGIIVTFIVRKLNKKAIETA
ncbi:MAG TPA: hypothetical protein DEF04_06905 [Clostridiales bacterium]|nr:hypothetical protein [Clostridiales bacterium]